MQDLSNDIYKDLCTRLGELMLSKRSLEMNQAIKDLRQLNKEIEELRQRIHFLNVLAPGIRSIEVDRNSLRKKLEQPCPADDVDCAKNEG